MGSRRNSSRLWIAGLVAVLGIIYTVGDSYYNVIMEQTVTEEEDNSIYDYKYDVIVDNPDSSFWQAVYDSAKTSARENNVLLEMKGTGRGTQYDKIDFMNISIASKADGIILEYNGESGLEEKINQAEAEGIPVVTVMSDAPKSKRQSFVGVSEYQLGTAYGEQVAEFVNRDTRDILILLKRNIDDMNQSQIYTQISNAALEKASRGQNINITGKNLLSTGTFETEEAVTDIFQQKSGIPDILVCMDEETTECARQAVIDFNLAGQVTIIGYYISDDILTAVEKGVISVTCDVDTSQLGEYSVEALTEYLKEGRANSYYNVDISFLGQGDVYQAEKEVQGDEEIPVE